MKEFNIFLRIVIILLIIYSIIQQNMILDELNNIKYNTEELSDIHQCLIDISHKKPCEPQNLDY